ncbi:MAG: endonuclease/exonuclease/phosphatase family protein [Actinobacteria bacterium]|nr:endonuclease/exonuclease/phosphatase family protein [Actinomycetota bacterium]MCB9388021.1 endonuclease/exonuclease/phosphatase family protein [Acidimicrobiia bacterium]
MQLTIASVNVNGIRAAARRGMSTWLQQCTPHILCLQEVRAEQAVTTDLLEDSFELIQMTGEAKGRAGVAIASTFPLKELSASAVESGTVESGTVESGAAKSGSTVRRGFETQGRLVLGEVALPNGRPLVVGSAYVHTGEASDPERMAEKLGFLDHINQVVSDQLAAGAEVIVAGDFNVARDSRDIKNWKGNRGKSGFLPEEQERLSALCDLGMVDLGRAHAGDVDGPYTWWSWRGRAYDNDAGWRIDYLFASEGLARHMMSCSVARAATYASRFSDHCPVVATFDL